MHGASDIKKPWIHGLGVTYDPIKKIRFEGEMANEEPCGIGRLFYPNGDYYAGEVQRFLKDGQGVLYKQDGEIVESIFNNDKEDGVGYIYKTDGSVYQGTFKNGKLQGVGEWIKDVNFMKDNTLGIDRVKADQI